MPRYFFHVHDRTSVLDEIGLELPDIAAARGAAIELSREILKDAAGGPLWEVQHWQVEVTDNPHLLGRTFFILEFSVTH